VLHAKAGDELWASLARLDAWRAQFPAAPASLTGALLLGSLIAPLGFSSGGWPGWMERDGKPGLNLGILPLSRRDIDRIHQVLVLQRRLREPSRSPRARQALMRRPAFPDALTWLEIHGDDPQTLVSWAHPTVHPGEPGEPGNGQRKRRRRRRRGRFPFRKSPE